MRYDDNQWIRAGQANERGWRWSAELGLYLGPQDGWLRYFDADGGLVLGLEEMALWEREQARQERQRAEQERRRAEQAQREKEQEHQRAERLAQRLRELGVSPD